MGVPVLTKKGHHFLSHYGESIVTNAGLDRWIASDEDEYIKKAILFSSDKELLNSLRKNLRSKLMSSALYDGRIFARHFEQAVQAMCDQGGD